MARDPRTLNLHMRETVHCMEACARPVVFENPFVSSSADLDLSTGLIISPKDGMRLIKLHSKWQ